MIFALDALPNSWALTACEQKCSFIHEHISFHCYVDDYDNTFIHVVFLKTSKNHGEVCLCLHQQP